MNDKDIILEKMKNITVEEKMEILSIMKGDIKGKSNSSGGGSSSGL